MRILLITENFPPETKSCSTLFFELGETLAKNGHKVKVITRKPRTNIAAGTDVASIPSKEIMAGMEVSRFQTPPLARNIPIIRGFEHFILGFIFLWGGLFSGSFDVVLVYSPPLPLGIAAILLAKIKGGRSVVNIQDLYPQTVIDLGLLKNPYLIWLAKKMENIIYRQADYIAVHSDGNKEYVLSNGGLDEKIDVVHNWVDTELIKPGPGKNEFSEKFGLLDKFVVSFAGVIGFAQGLEVVINAAQLLKDNKEIVFIIVGDGIKKAELENESIRLKLTNVRFIETQPVSIYPQVLNASDISLAILDKTLVTPVIPGKILSIMASGKPVLASLALTGDAPKVIDENKCGLVVPPGDPHLLANAILKLYNDKELREEMGRNGRQAAVRLFSRSACIKKYEDIFSFKVGGEINGL
ncbi:glycosyltransferase family 4 protein [Candidatus Saganbacteria bacterium]|nr:glycosyltransferase family 4 protein [Candidatus Saganbacteria bacterium]